MIEIPKVFLEAALASIMASIVLWGFIFLLSIICMGADTDEMKASKIGLIAVGVFQVIWCAFWSGLVVLT